MMNMRRPLQIASPSVLYVIGGAIFLNLCVTYVIVRNNWTGHLPALHVVEMAPLPAVRDMVTTGRNSRAYYVFLNLH